MFESIINFFKKTGKPEKEIVKSKDAAKERLHLVLMQDRANVSADFLELMKQEIIEVIKKYIDVDETAIDVRLTNKENGDGTNGAPALYANIPIINIKNEARKVDTKKAKEAKKAEVKEEKELKKENENKGRQEDKKSQPKKEKVKTEKAKNQERVDEKIELDEEKSQNEVKIEKEDKKEINEQEEIKTENQEVNEQEIQEQKTNEHEEENKSEKSETKEAIKSKN